MASKSNSKTPLERIRDNVKFLIKETEEKPKEQWNVGEIKKKTAALSADATAAEKSFESLTSVRDSLSQQIDKIHTALGVEVPSIKERRHSRGMEALFDFIRLLIVWGLAIWSLRWPGPSAGWVAIVVADVYIVIVLLTAAIRSDEIYAIRNEALRWVMYEIMPSRLVAPLFVAGLFCALWWGFAALYQQRLPSADALQLSFLTLATFNGPEGQETQLHSLILYELGSAILLLICIFSMLINRISEF